MIKDKRSESTFPSQQLFTPDSSATADQGQQTTCLPSLTSVSAPLTLPREKQRGTPVVHYELTQSTVPDNENSSVDLDESLPSEPAKSNPRHRQRTQHKAHPCPPQPSTSHKKRRRSFIIPRALRRPRITIEMVSEN
ncbi:hypothetical protein FGIG_02753 [Fasciola gigantica]|uniref:Uncharacterized protein n=1 Tax=Fasciola gigantica TaxID=46835 RepID=A0A504YHL3_FASGI|nr:hypothetical protein FGIG_02753 [Fasciola gigantica]